MSGFEVGPQYGATGSHNADARVGITGCQVITDAHGHFFEAVRLGITGTGQGVWSATTGAAGVAPGTVLSTTPPLAIWNPPNSGVMLVLLVSRFGFVSGTLGAGTLEYAYVATQATKPTTGTALISNPQIIGSQSTPRAQAFQGSTLASTPVALAPAFVLNAMTTTTATAPAIAKDIIDGEIVVLPGGVFVMQGIAAAGTTPLALLGATWEEVPLLF